MGVDRSRRARAARRRTRRLDRVEHDRTAEHGAARQAAWAGCADCGATGTSRQRDSVLAIPRGGRSTTANGVPACRSCNTSRCNAEVTGWLRRTRLDDRASLVHHLEFVTPLVRDVGVGGA